MFRVIPVICAVLIVFVGSFAAEARINIRESTKYYNIRGKTAKDVLAQIDRKSASHLGKRHAVATTLIKLSIDKVKIGVRGRKCRVKNLRVKLSLTYNLPRWRNIRQGTNDSQRKWNNYFKQVVVHEKKHGALAKKFARKLERAALKVTGRTSRNCSDLTRKLKRTFESHDRQHDRQQTAFDRRDHRRTSRVMKLHRAFALSN